MEFHSDFTHNNHFKFGYDNQWYVNRTKPTQTWMCDYGVAENQNYSVKQANADAAVKIWEEAERLGLSIYLLLSGGLDSEVAARAFLDAEVPFIAAVVKYKANFKENPWNFHESRFADMFCKQYSINKLDLILNPTEFFESDEIIEIANIAQTRSGQLACSMWAARQLGKGYIVLGQGEPYLYRQFGKWWFREKELIGSWHKFWMFAGIKGTAGFHQYTPDQMLAYLTDPLLQDQIWQWQNRRSYTLEPLNNASIKQQLYQSHYPEADFLTRKKYTGFERMIQLDSNIRAVLTEKFSSHYAEHCVEYHEMLNRLKGKKLNNS